MGNQRISCVVDTPEYRQLHDIAGKTVGFEWVVYAGHATIQILAEIQRMFEIENTHPSQFKGRIILMSWYQRQLQENCDIPPRLLTKVTQHETPDLLDITGGSPLQPVEKRISVEVTNLEPSCLEAGFSKSAEVGQCFVTRPAIM